MGYRSEVAYIAKFYVEDAWNVFLIEAKSKPETRLCFEDDNLRVVNEEMEIRFHADGVKWYDEYDEVQCHQALWTKARERCDDDGIEVDGAYCRIGEESDDVDERYFGNDPWDMVRISRQIVVDWM